MSNRGDRTLFLNLGLAVLTLCGLFLSLSIGPISFSIWDATREIFQGLQNPATIALREIRLPRALLALCVGATLGLSGAAMQGLLRNPLAEPGILGVTGGAVLGAVLMLYTGFASAFQLALPLGGMTGAFLSIIILYLLAGYSPSIQTLILAGVALNILAFAGTSLALNLSPNPYAAIEIVFWQMGSLTNRSFEHLFLALPFMLLGWGMLLWDTQGLNALTLGEETASTLGINMKALRARLIIGTALSVGAAVSVCGSIGFVGLVVPHLIRPFVGYEPGKLLLPSALGGAFLILIADVLIRVIPSQTELKIGVLTALVGAPFFIFILYKMKKDLP